MRTNRYVLILLFIVGGSILSFSQQQEADAKINFLDGNYDIALKQYLKIYKKEKDNDVINYRIGVCYLMTNYNKAEAIPYLEMAKNSENIIKKEAGDIIFFQLGQAYLHAHRFDEAIAQIEDFKRRLDKSLPDYSALIKEADSYISMSKNAKLFIAKPESVQFINVGEEINSDRSEYMPHVAEDESYMIYTSNKRYISDFQVLVNNIYISKSFMNKWAKGKTLSTKINTEEDEICVGISKDADKVITQRLQFDGLNDLYLCERKGKAYQVPVLFGENISSKESEGGACFSLNCDTIYFASDRPLGYGGYDIYFSVKLPNGEWGIPMNMGPDINTPYDDNYPSLAWGGDAFFFASNGHNSMGGYDIFQSTLQNDKSWGKPKNLGFPINDTYDNYNISFTQNPRYAYIASVRKEGKGDFDIYKVIINTVEKPTIIYRGVIAVGDSIAPSALKEKDSEIYITVYNISSSDQEFANTNYDGTELTEVYGQYSYIKATGNYIISLTPGKYVIRVEGDAYITYNKKIFIPDQPADLEYLLNIFLQAKTE